MSSEFLNYHLFLEEKMKEIALRRFSAAWRSGRLVVFAGSGATAEMGYGSWSGIISDYLKDAVNLIGGRIGDTPVGIPPRDLQSLLQGILNSHEAELTKDGRIDMRALASVAEQVLQYSDGITGRGGDTLYDQLEREAGDRAMPKGHHKDPKTVQAILRSLGIERILTLNYDLEFEWEMMAPHLSGAGAVSEQIADKIFDPKTVPEDLDLGKSNKTWTNEDMVHRDRRTQSLTKFLPGGQSVRSDVFLRERTDRLIEFAIGSPEYEGHVFHLHGRADFPESMVLSLRDYDRMYRRSGIAKLPFEHALKILFAGNPILCVGLGMNETEINDTLQRFVADHPRSSFAQIFVLWHEPDPQRRTLIRYNWQQKLGAHALFLSDLTDGMTISPPSSQDTAMRKAQAKAHEKLLHNALVARGAGNSKGRALKERRLTEREIISLSYRPPSKPSQPLARQVEVLAAAAFKRLEPQDYDAHKNAFRSLSDKLREWHEDAHRKPLKFWAMSALPKDGNWQDFLDRSQPSLSAEILVIHGPSARGKAILADKLITQIKGKRRLLIHCNFAFDVDAMLSGLSGLITGTPCDSGDEPIARPKYWTESEADNRSFWNPNGSADEANKSNEAAVIFNDFDRFLDRAGLPLSSELDLLCREIVKRPESNGIRWIFIGTDRVRRYFDMLGRLSDNKERVGTRQVTFIKSEPRDGEDHFDRIKEAFNAATAGPIDGFGAKVRVLTDGYDPTRWVLNRRSALADYLKPTALKVPLKNDHELALEILTVMAFIGQTVEPFVLAYAPRIRRFIQRPPLGGGLSKYSMTDKGFRSRIERLLQKLVNLQLVQQIGNFQPSESEWRYGLHRTVLAELRDRLGVPLGEAKLATAFNLSLFVAQPTDSYNPEDSIHDELGKLVDFLIGAYKDNWGPPSKVPKGVDPTKWARIQPHVSSCLRSALAVLRSYYSTAALVTFDVSGRPGDEEEDRPGPLTEHAERLERLIWAAEETIAARADLKDYIRQGGLVEQTAPPFYPDDLVWLHNERGVAKMMQGDLYEARASFDAAQKLSGDHVEFGFQGPNWLRIQLNQLAVDFERGRLKEVRSRIDDIVTSELIGGHETLKLITEEYGTWDAQNADSGKVRTVVSSKFTHDQLLTIGITTGYRAMVDMLGGRLETSKQRFLSALTILRKISEPRAYAMFSIHCASLINALRDRKQAVIMIETAVAMLQSSQQRDLGNLAEVKDVWLAQYGETGWDQNAHLQKLRGILEYAVAADMHRVRVETRATLANMKIKSGDYDAALEHAADAMAVATRFGMSLRKIALRNLLGQILIKRGDRFSGHALIDQAVREADRIGYQRAIERAQDIKSAEGRLIDRPDY
jgi:tetratricopeptide (TPR) repeat protein